MHKPMCFVCMERPPEYTVTRGENIFLVCELCSKVIEYENRKENAMKNALYASRGGDILRMVLGANLLPTHLIIKKMEKQDENS